MNNLKLAIVTFLLLEFLQPFSYLGMKGLRFSTFQAVDAVEHSLEKDYFYQKFKDGWYF